MIYSTRCCLWHLQLQLLSCGAVLASAMPLFNTVVLATTLKDFLLTGASVTYSVSSTASIIYCANQIEREVEECVLKLHDALLMLANHNQCQKNETCMHTLTKHYNFKSTKKFFKYDYLH